MMNDADHPSLILLGGFELRLPGRPALEPPARKAVALLAYLALNPARAQRRERLAALLWGEQDESRARQSLRQALAGLRRLLPAGIMTTTAAEVTLRGLTVDALDFAELAKVDDDWTLEKAVALYSGDLLEGFDARAPAFEDWLAIERSRLRELAISALAALLERAQQRREPEPVVRLALRLLALDPLHEPARRQLMRAYAATGRVPDALRQYRRLRRLLQQELQLAPEPSTTALYRELVALRREVDNQQTESDRAAHQVRSRNADAVADAPASRIETPPDQDSDAANQSPSEAELRPVSVLALRWTPAAALLRTDAERFAEVEAALDRCLGETAEALGGTPLPGGQGMRLLLFGSRHSRRDDPARALQAAVRLRDAAATRIDGQVAIALHVGSALCRDQAAPSGPVLHQCAELLRAASDGEILLSDLLRRQVAPPAVVEAVRQDDSAEAAEPAWRLTDPLAFTEVHEPPMVGRRRELALLRAALQGLTDGSGQAILIRGEPGIGKTRLIEALRAEASRCGVHTDLTAVLDFGDSAADPIRALLARLLGVSEQSSGDTLAQALATELDNAGMARSALWALASLVGLPADRIAGADAQVSPPQPGTVLATLLSVATRERPRLLIVEDIHWAAASLHRLLAALAEATAGSAALLVMTSRYQGAPLDPSWRAAMHGAPLTTIDLGPLTRTEGQELGRQIATTRRLALPEPAASTTDAKPDPVAHCVERAAGHPLFIEQLLLAAEAAPERSSGETGSSMPEMIQSVVLARLDALPRPARAALQAASILGQHFGRDALAGLLGGDPVPEILLAHRLLRPDGSDLAFAHALIRDAVLASLPSVHRRRLHQTAAAWYAACDPVLQARHLALAGSPEAAAVHLTAARGLLANCEHAQAAALADAGLALTTEPLLRAELMLTAGEGLTRSGETAQAVARFAEAAALAGVESGAEVEPQRRSSARVVLARALLGRARSLTFLEQPEAALETLAAAEAEARAAGDVDLAADIRFERGNVLFNLARLDECLATHSALAKQARSSGSLRHQALAEGGLGDAEYLRGRMVTAHGHFRRCVELLEQSDLSARVPAHLAMQAWTAFFCNRVAEGIADAERALALARATHDAHAEGVVQGALVPMLLANGQISNARDEAERALTHARRLGAPRQIADALTGLAEAHGLAGERELARRLLDQARGVLGRPGLPYAGAIIHGLLARFADDEIQRRAAIDAGDGLLDSASISHNCLLYHQAAIDAWLEARDWARIEHHARALVEYTAAEPLPWADFHIRRARALAAAGRGQADPARLHQLIDEGRHAGLHLSLAALEQAAGVGGSALTGH